MVKNPAIMSWIRMLTRITTEMYIIIFKFGKSVSKFFSVIVLKTFLSYLAVVKKSKNPVLDPGADSDYH